MLTHYNIASNVEQLNQVFMLGRNDKILGILPFFHSFGFTGTLCLPTSIGMGVVFHPNPLEPRAIGALVSQYGSLFFWRRRRSCRRTSGAASQKISAACNM